MSSIRFQKEEGFVLVTVAAFLVVLLMLAGFAVDLGSWYLRANKLQRASDAAALSGSAKLPDQAAAKAAAEATLQANGFDVSGGRLTMSASGDNDSYSVEITDHAVPTYFIKMVDNGITMTRKSKAKRGSRSPVLGSPFNVLGTGSLDIPNIPQQNFWLAINGRCDPKEDGDFFNAKYDANKGPFSSEVDSRHYYKQTSETRHHCPLNDGSGVGVVNPNAGNNSGYNYFVDVPPTQSGSVSIEAYDPVLSADADAIGHIDDYTNTKQGDIEVLDETQFLVYRDDKNTPNDYTDDTGPIGTKLYLARKKTAQGGFQAWSVLYVASGSEIANGARYRINVSSADVATEPRYDPGRIGVNAFALGAFKNGAHVGCDTRTDITCPRTYGLSAMSVYNSLHSIDDGRVDYYLADIDKSFIGETVNIYLWDPGEGTKRLQVVAPDGTALPIQWTSTPDAPGLSGSGNSIDTSGYRAPYQPNLSNDYKYNDRLLTITLKLPDNYGDMVDHANGDTGIRLRYKMDDAPNDRLTLGVSTGDGVFAPNHLSAR